MVKDEIEDLRERLNNMVIDNIFSSKDLLKVSRELDILLLKYLNQYQPHEYRK